VSKYELADSFLMVILTPASPACCASSVTAWVKPGTMSEVCSVTARLLLPAFLSNALASSMSRSRGFSDFA